MEENSIKICSEENKSLSLRLDYTILLRYSNTRNTVLTCRCDIHTIRLSVSTQCKKSHSQNTFDGCMLSQKSTSRSKLTSLAEEEGFLPQFYCEILAKSFSSRLRSNPDKEEPHVRRVTSNMTKLGHKQLTLYGRPSRRTSRVNRMPAAMEAQQGTRCRRE